MAAFATLQSDRKFLVDEINRYETEAEYATKTKQPLFPQSDVLVLVSKSIELPRASKRSPMPTRSSRKLIESTLLMFPESSTFISPGNFSLLEVASADPVLHRTILSLYCTMSGIKWDYDVSTVKGGMSQCLRLISPKLLTVSNFRAVIYGQADAIPFDINPNEMSQVEVTSQLWKLIDQSHEVIEV